jgi:periplasmic copper chaperone A
LVIELAKFVIMTQLIPDLEGQVMRRVRMLVFLTYLALLSACVPASSGSGATIEVTDAWARAAMAMATEGHGEMPTPAEGTMAGTGANSAAYMLLRNKTSTPDKLLGVESQAAKAVELHVSELQGDVMTMRPIEFVEVPANGEAELKPGGMHVMLIGLKHDLKAGEVIDLVLVFEKAGRIKVQAEVRAP